MLIGWLSIGVVLVYFLLVFSYLGVDLELIVWCIFRVFFMLLVVLGFFIDFVILYDNGVFESCYFI